MDVDASEAPRKSADRDDAMDVTPITDVITALAEDVMLEDRPLYLRQPVWRQVHPLPTGCQEQGRGQAQAVQRPPQV